MLHHIRCAKSDCIRSYCGPHILAFELILCISPYSVRMRENVDQNNSEYGHFSPSDMLIKFLKTTPIYQSPNIYSVLLTIMPDQFAAVVKVQRQSPDDFSSKKLL